VPNDDTDPNTGLPRKVSLGSVLDQIMLAPHEIASILTHWSQSHQGSPQADLPTKLSDAASATLNPKSYGLSGETVAPAPVVPVSPQPAVMPSFDLGGPKATTATIARSDANEPDIS
jgi:hypothetical protein